MKKFTKEWLLNAFIRAIRTFAQTALGFITIGMAFSEVDWMMVLSVSGVSMIYSILTSMVTGLPESTYDGKLLVDDHGETTKWLLQVDTPVEDVNNMKSIRLKVEPEAVLSAKQDYPVE